MEVVETFTKSAVNAYQEKNTPSNLYDDILESASRPEHAPLVKSVCTSVAKEAVETYVRSSARESQDTCTASDTDESSCPTQISKTTAFMPQWMVASWDTAKTADGRAFVCDVVGTVCRESTFAVLEGLGIIKQDKKRFIEEEGEEMNSSSDYSCNGPRIVEVEEDRQDYTGLNLKSLYQHYSPHAISETLPSHLDAVEIMRTMLIVIVAILISLMLYYYCSFMA